MDRVIVSFNSNDRDRIIHELKQNGAIFLADSPDAVLIYIERWKFNEIRDLQGVRSIRDEPY